MYNNLGRREKGKIAEFQVISKLISLGLDLYVPVIDIGIDCILRTEKHAEPAKYYEIQIKSAPYKNVSIRGAKKIIQFIDKKIPKNYFLVIALRDNEKIKHVIYLTTEQIKKYIYPSPKAKEIDINVPARDRDLLVKSQPIESLIAKLES